MVPRQLWRFTCGLLLEAKFGNFAYLHVPDVISRWHGALAHLLDRVRLIYIYTTSLPSLAYTPITVLLW